MDRIADCSGRGIAAPGVSPCGGRANPSPDRHPRDASGRHFNPWFHRLPHASPSHGLAHTESLAFSHALAHIPRPFSFPHLRSQPHPDSNLSRR